MANPNIAEDGAASRFKKGEKRPKRPPIDPAKFAELVDGSIAYELVRLRRAKESIPPQLLAVAVQRIKDLGQTQPPAVKVTDEKAGLEAEMAAALRADDARKGSAQRRTPDDTP